MSQLDRGAVDRALRRESPDTFGTTAFYASIGRALVTMCGVIAVLFLIELINYLSSGALDRDGGIIPRHLGGLDGVVFAPFLHASWAHLYGNAVPFLLTGTFVLASGGRRFVWVTILVTLISGLTVWIFGSGLTVGVSGVIFGYLGFLLMRGVVERSWWNIAVALFIGLLYWSAFTVTLPGDPRISWQGHIAGFLSGVLAAFLLRRRRPKPSQPPAVGAATTLSTPTIPLTSPTIPLTSPTKSPEPSSD